MTDLDEVEIPVALESLSVALRQAVLTGRAAQLLFDWEISPAGEFRFCLGLEDSP
jgi:hypothetical protein